MSPPRISYQHTQSALKEMQAATQLDDLTLGWELFLIYHQRTWNKCEAHYKGKPFWGRLRSKYSAKRKGDPALIYVHHARHVDEHGISPITQIQPGFTTITRGKIGGGSKITGGGVAILAPGSTASLTINPTTVVADPVTNRGVTFVPPVLAGETSPPVLLIAEETIKFYDDLFAEITVAGGD